MHKLSKMVLGAVMVLGLMLVGCSENFAPTSSPENLSAITLPAGAAVNSATLYIYVNTANSQSIDVHRVTSMWEEGTVTWNNFGSSFDPAVVNSFTADAVDWRSVDITSLVNGWLNGDYPNYGLLLDQIEQTYPRARYNSRDNVTNHPFVEICYSVGGEDFCEEASIDADAYIWQIAPDQNFGFSAQLFTGWLHETDLEKQSLLYFDIDQEPSQGGCTRTIGYYKTHAGFGPQDDVVTPLLPVWLGTPAGDKSMQVTTAATAVDILTMKTYGSPSNGITKLYAQLLAAKFNVINGAADDDIADVLMTADDFLASHDWTDWDSLSKRDRRIVNQIKDRFDRYNNGDLGPGHCGDSYDGEYSED